MINSFHIVNSSAVDIDLYENSNFVKENRLSIERLRILLHFVEVKNYKGIGRTTFSAEPFYLNRTTKQILTWADTSNFIVENKLAKYKVLEIEKEQADNNKLDFYFDNLKEIDSVFEVLEDKRKYEKIEVILGEDLFLPKSYGFDIGYWTGDFSIIADIAIKPMWHPPDFDDMDDIVLHLKRLNQYCLFNNYNDALLFKELYLSKKWAEQNWYESDDDKDGDIKIVLVRPA